MADADDAAAKAAARKQAADDRRAAMRQMMRERRMQQQEPAVDSESDVVVKSSGSVVVEVAAAANEKQVAEPERSVDKSLPESKPKPKEESSVVSGSPAKSPIVSLAANERSSANAVSVPSVAAASLDENAIRSPVVKDSPSLLNGQKPVATSRLTFHPELGDFPVLQPVLVDTGVASAAVSRLLEFAAATRSEAQADAASANGVAAGGGHSVAAVARKLREECGAPLFQAAQLLETTAEYTEKDADKLRFNAFRRGVEAGKAAEAALAEAKRMVGDEDVVGKSMSELQAYAEEVLSQAATTALAKSGVSIPNLQSDALGIAQALIAEHARLRQAVQTLQAEARKVDEEHAAAVAASEAADRRRSEITSQCSLIEARRRETEAEYATLRVRAEEALSIATTKSEDFKAQIDRELRRVQATLRQDALEAERLQKLLVIVKRDNADVHALFDQIVATHESVVGGEEDGNEGAGGEDEPEQDEY